MDLINRRARVYGPPATLIASNREWDIVVSYGPSAWNQQHDCFLNGVPITKTSIREGDHHVWCLFPDGRVMIVREEKIKAVKRNRQIALGVKRHVQRAA